VELTEMPRRKEADQQCADSKSEDVACRSQIKVAYPNRQKIPDAGVKEGQRTFTVDEESPLPGGFAKGD
jgi:hypothetical protein